MNDEAVYRTAPATPGLLIILAVKEGLNENKSINRSGVARAGLNYTYGGFICIK